MGTILDRDDIALSGIGIGAALAAADTRTACIAGGGHGGPFTGNGDSTSQTGTSFAARRAVAAADGRAARTAGGFHMGTAVDGDVTALSGTVTIVTLAAADTCAARAAVGGDGAAGNGDVSGISTIFIAGNVAGIALTAADTGCARTAGGGDGAAGDGDVAGEAAAGLDRTADARAARAAGGGQAAGLAGLVLKGQGVVFIGACAEFLQRRMALAAGQGIAAVQLQRHLALRIDGSLAGVAGVDVHVVQRDRCGNALLGVDGRRVVRLLALGGQGDRRFVLIVIQLDLTVLHKVAVRILLGDISATALGVHGHAALGQVVSVRKGCRGDGRDHCHQRSRRKHPQGQLSIGIDSHA